jgi:hypothetical protein
MDQWYRGDFMVEQGESAGNDMRFQKGSVPCLLQSGKYIRKISGNGIYGFLLPIAWNDAFVQQVVSPQVVYAVYMVSMGMREQHGIDMWNLFPEGLAAQVG